MFQLKHLSRLIFFSLFLFSQASGWAASTGLLIPFYIYPSPATKHHAAAIQPLVEARSTYPQVPIRAILNPNSGVGESIDVNYSRAIKQLQAADVTVLGYVATTYGKRPIHEVFNEISTWVEWYQPEGIFLDEMGDRSQIYLNQDGSFNADNYYSLITNFAHQLGLKIVVGNPGYALHTMQAGEAVDNIVIYENPGLPNLEEKNLKNWMTLYAENSAKLSTLVLDQPSLDRLFLGNIARSMEWIYLTDDPLPNPWDALPSYFEELLQTLQELNQSSS